MAFDKSKRIQCVLGYFINPYRFRLHGGEVITVIPISSEHIFMELPYFIQLEVGVDNIIKDVVRFPNY